MSEFRPPSSDDLNKYIVLNRFLWQVHSHTQNINDETERFISLLNQLGEVLKEHRCDTEDLTNALSDYEDELKRVKSINLPEQRNNQFPGHVASITADREPRKAEG